MKASQVKNSTIQNIAGSDGAKRTSKQSNIVGRSVFFFNSHQDIQQKELQKMADNSNQVRQLQIMQKSINTHQLKDNPNPAPIQRKAMTPIKLQNGGFTGPHQGNTFQYNFPRSAGIHATVRLETDNLNTKHFHIRKDSKGGVNNRINYDETAPNDWQESIVNVIPALTQSMQNRGNEMRNWMKKN